jgi:hypothetical protein
MSHLKQSFDNMDELEDKYKTNIAADCFLMKDSDSIHKIMTLEEMAESSLEQLLEKDDEERKILEKQEDMERKTREFLEEQHHKKHETKAKRLQLMETLNHFMRPPSNKEIRT